MSRSQEVRDQRDALYILSQRVQGKLGGLDPVGDGAPVKWSEIAEIQRWLRDETDQIIPERQAIVEEIGR